jgi:RNA polymerase sigma factor (sigma-70 family)
MGPSSDRDLVAASVDQPTAFGEIFDRHAPVILRFLVRRVGPGQAEQLLGETFRIAFERRAVFDPERGGVRPWLYGIAINLLRRHRRSEQRRLRATSRLAARRDGAVPDEENVIAAADAQVLLPSVAEVMLDLPDAERDVLVLFAWEELGYEEIASALEIPVGTVRSRLNRARRRISARLTAPADPRPEPAKGGTGRDR